MPVKVLLSGYYGYNNIGDEAILKGLIDSLQVYDVKLKVLSKNPEWTTKKYSVESADRSNLWQVLKEIKNCDVLLSGGGSLLQDVTSSKSIIYYLMILLFGIIFGKKTIIYSQGIGPIKGKFNRKFTKFVLNRVDYINVRDNNSHDYLRKIGIKKDITVTTDTVFGINKPSLKEGQGIIDNYSKRDSKKLGVTIINWKDLGDRTVEESVKLLKIILEEKPDVDIFLIPFYYHVDLDILTKIYNRLKDDFENIYLVDKYLHVDGYLSLVGNMDIYLSMRLHGLIFATLMGAYPIGISYDPKIDGFMKELNRNQNFYVEDFDGEKVANEILYSLEDIERLNDKLNSDVEYFRNIAKESAENLYEFIR